METAAPATARTAPDEEPRPRGPAPDRAHPSRPHAPPTTTARAAPAAPPAPFVKVYGVPGCPADLVINFLPRDGVPELAAFLSRLGYDVDARAVAAPANWPAR